MKLHSKMNVGCGPGTEPSNTCVPRWTYHYTLALFGFLGMSEEMLASLVLKGYKKKVAQMFFSFSYLFTFVLFCLFLSHAFFIIILLWFKWLCVSKKACLSLGRNPQPFAISSNLIIGDG